MNVALKAAPFEEPAVPVPATVVMDHAVFAKGSKTLPAVHMLGQLQAMGPALPPEQKDPAGQGAPKPEAEPP